MIIAKTELKSQCSLLTIKFYCALKIDSDFLGEKNQISFECTKKCVFSPL